MAVNNKHNNKIGMIMVKKSLLSLAIAASVTGMTGCNISSTDNNKSINQTPIKAGQPGFQSSNAAPIFSAARSELPVGVDLVFSKASYTDGTVDVGDPDGNPVLAGLNTLDGFSITAPIDIQFSADLDPASVVAGKTVFLVKLTANGETHGAGTYAGIDPLDLNSIGVAVGLNNKVAITKKDDDTQKLYTDIAGNKYYKDDDDSKYYDAAGTEVDVSGVEGKLVQSFRYTYADTDPAVIAQKSGLVVSPNQPTAGTDYSARFVSLDGQPTLRIQPEKPLQARSKYIVVVTDQVKRSSGDAAVPSWEYKYLTDDTASLDLNQDEYGNESAASAKLINPALAPVARALRGWEAIAGGALTAFTKTLDTDNAVPDLGQGNVILSFGYTTGGAEASLKTLAAPGLFLDALGLAKVEGIFDTLAAPATHDNMIAAATPTDPYPLNMYRTLAGADLGGLGLAGQSINSLAGIPAAQTFNLIPGAAIPPSVLFAADTDNPLRADSVTTYQQGMLHLPEFLTGVAATMAEDTPWVANISLGAVLDSAGGNPAGSTPPKDVKVGGEDVNTNVTYRYPFPNPVSAGAKVPVLVTVPGNYTGLAAPFTGPNCTGAQPYKVAIFVHGITSNRTASAGYARALANKGCMVTVAMDLPLHGIAPKETDRNGELVDNSRYGFVADVARANGAATPWASAAAVAGTFGDMKERHGNKTQNDVGARVDMSFEAGAEVGTSGSAFINLQNFARSRDNLRQGVYDVMVLNASLGNIETALGVDLDLDNVTLVGHSLGGIIATTAASVINDAKVQIVNSNLNDVDTLILGNTSGHITKLLENSPSFAPTIVAGLKAAKVSQGTGDYEKFMAVMQASLDAVDPVGFASGLSTTPTLLVNMVGGAAFATGDDPSVPDAFKANNTYVPDLTVPNFDYFADASTNPFAGVAAMLTGGGKLPGGLPTGLDSAKAPMTGTNGLSTLLGLTKVNADTGAGATSETRVETRFKAGTHSTLAAGDSATAFTEIIGQSLTLIGGAHAVADTEVLESSN